MSSTVPMIADYIAPSGAVDWQPYETDLDEWAAYEVSEDDFAMWACELDQVDEDEGDLVEVEYFDDEDDEIYTEDYEEWR